MTESLFQIAEELAQIDELLTASGGELTDEIEEALEVLEGEFFDKVEKLGAYCLQLESLAEQSKAEKDRINRVHKVRENKVRRIKAMLKMLFERTGRDRVETVRFRVTLVNNSQASIEWTGSDEEIPEAFRVETHTVSVDKAAAREYYGQHGKLPDGFTVEHGTHVRIT